MLGESYDVAMVQAQMGWSDCIIMPHYGHASTRSRQAAAAVLDQFADPVNEPEKYPLFVHIYAGYGVYAVKAGHKDQLEASEKGRKIQESKILRKKRATRLELATLSLGS